MVLADLGSRLRGAISNVNVTDKTEVNQMIKEICTALLETDVNIKLVAKLRDNLNKKIQAELEKKSNPNLKLNLKKLVQKIVFDELTALVDASEEPAKPKKGRVNVIMFVGLQGSGKTTSCTKLAVYYQRRGFKVGLVCADTFRAGAFDQLKQNATKAKIPYYGSYTELDPVKISFEGVEKFKKEKFEIIIVDTSGRHRQELDLFREMVEIGETINPNQTIMVLDASIGQAAEAQATAFKESSNFGSIILTKMDGHAKGGGAISAVAATNTPISFIGTGEHVQDFETFTPKQFISKLLGIGDIQGLIEHVQTLNLDQKETMENIQKGKFTLNDFHTQMNNVLKMGPLSQIASMLPGGMGQIMNSMGEEETTKRIKRMVYIMDSMTKKELDSDGRMFTDEPSRIIRVARGSGTSVTEVEMVLQQRKMMETMAQSSKHLMGGNGAPGGLPGNGKLNQSQMARAMQQMQSNPNMMQNAMNNMKQMFGGQMPDMSSMFGGGGMPNPQDMMQMMNNPQMQNMMKQFGMG